MLWLDQFFRARQTIWLCLYCLAGWLIHFSQVVISLNRPKWCFNRQFWKQVYYFINRKNYSTIFQTWERVIDCFTLVYVYLILIGAHYCTSRGFYLNRKNQSTLLIKTNRLFFWKLIDYSNKSKILIDYFALLA